MTVPLKLKDSAAPTELQVFTSTEENYLAYQAGLHLASGDSSDVGSLALVTHGSENIIGSVVDTSYDSAVGTGGDQATLTFTTVTTPLKQTRGTITPSGANNRLPIMQRVETGQRVIREMNDSDMSSLLDRINSRIFTSDYPGSYKLASSTPAGGYTFVKTLTTDTRTDGTNISYNLYRRTSMTAPTKVLPFSIKRSAGSTGTYQGLQLMTDDQVKYSLGTRLQNKISSDTTGVGNYRIYSSAAGTPSNNGLSGTWVAKGTVTDTRQAIVDANYTRTRVSNYARLRTSTYAGEYSRTRNSVYVRTSLTSFARDYSATYTKTRESLYTVSGFIGNFIGNYTTTRSEDFTRQRADVAAYSRTITTYTQQDYSRIFDYLGNYTRTSTGIRGQGDFIGDYSRSSTKTSTYSRNISTDFIGNYTRAVLYTGNYIGDYTGDFLRDHLTTSEGVTYSRNFTGNYTGDYIGNYSRNFSDNYQRTRSSAYSANYQRTRATNYARNFLGDYTGNYTRNSTVNFTRSSSNTFVGDYTRISTRSSTATYLGDFIGDFQWSWRRKVEPPIFWLWYYQNYTRISTRNSIVNFTGNFTGEYQRTRSSSYTGDFVGDFTGNFTGEYQRTRSSSYTGDYVGDFTGNYAGAYQRTRSSSYTGNFLGDYTGNYTRNFAGDYVGNYSRAYSANYTRDFTRTRSSNYIGLEGFSRNFVGEFIGNYSRNFTNTFVGDYSRNFAGNYIGDYARNFTGNYSRNFIGNYAGDTIGSGNINIETYTLYVRTV